MAITRSILAPSLLLLGFLLTSCGIEGETDGGLRAEDPPPAATGLTEGVVMRVEQKPNMAEDGVFRIEVMTKDSGTVLVRADEFLNTPIQPEDQGKECLAIDPAIKRGDLVAFALPRAEKDYAEAVDPDGRFASVVTTCGAKGEELSFTIGGEAFKISPPPD